MIPVPFPGTCSTALTTGPDDGRRLRGVHEATYQRLLRQLVLVGLPVEEVASQLNVPVGTVKSRLSRRRAALARRLTSAPEVVRHDR